MIDGKHTCTDSSIALVAQSEERRTRDSKIESSTRANTTHLFFPPESINWVALTCESKRVLYSGQASCLQNCLRTLRLRPMKRGLSSYTPVGCIIQRDQTSGGKHLLFLFDGYFYMPLPKLRTILDARYPRFPALSIDSQTYQPPPWTGRVAYPHHPRMGKTRPLMKLTYSG